MVSPATNPTIQILKEIKLFQVFKDPELVQLLAAGQTQTVEAFANIVIEGEFTWGLYLILDGTVGVFKSNQISGTTYDVGQLGSGSFFGEMSLVDENPRSATVRSLTECKLFFISKEAFIQFLGRSSELKLRFYESCIQNLVSRLRDLNDNYVISQYQLWKTALIKGKEEVA